MHRNRVPRSLLALATAGLLAAPASATWSIVLVDRGTREVAVSVATCLANFDLQEAVPVVWVGAGAGAAQSTIDFTADNRRLMRDGLRAGDTPAAILDELLFGAGTTPGRRQYGIAALSGPAATWTGGQAGFARFGVTGEVDGITYAIQGNVLAGDEIVLAAEAALRATKGDVGQRLIAGMLAARRIGGDGRCSCAENAPTSCGVPPPGFEKSAHAGTMIVARLGDTDGNCNVNGCATGDYYLGLNVIGGAGDPDPVDELARLHGLWRRSLSGRPDQQLSVVKTTALVLPADGVSELLVSVRLHDVDGEPLRRGGARIVARPADPLAPEVAIGAVTDHGDGSYSFAVRAGLAPGRAALRIVADDGVRAVQLYPDTEIELVAPAPLVAGARALSVSDARPVPFVVHEPDRGGAPFALVLGLSAPGAHPPLEPEAWLASALAGTLFVADAGRLDAGGRAGPSWTPAAPLPPALAGARLVAVALTHERTLRATNAVTLALVP